MIGYSQQGKLKCVAMMFGSRVWFESELSTATIYSKSARLSPVKGKTE